MKQKKIYWIKKTSDEAKIDLMKQKRSDEEKKIWWDKKKIWWSKKKSYWGNLPPQKKNWRSKKNLLSQKNIWWGKNRSNEAKTSDEAKIDLMKQKKIKRSLPQKLSSKIFFVVAESRKYERK